MMTEIENNSQDTVKIPEFGEVEVILAVNAEGCVDPRESLSPKEVQGTNNNWNTAIHHEGAERSPGASFGKAMSLKGAVPTLSPQKAVDIVRGWEESEGRTFTLHEADQVHGNGLGCGHIDKASDDTNQKLFELEAESVRQMRDYVKESTATGDMKVDVPKLTGAHREKAVLVVLSDDKTVRATDGKEEFFRFDALRHDKSLKKLAQYARNNGVQVEDTDLIAAAEKQRNAILMLLAGGLPIYEIDLRDGKKIVTPKGTVPELSSTN